VPVYLNVCSECVHNNGNRTCSAYPAKIPDAVWNGSDPHTSVRPDQAGRDTLLVRDQAGLDYLVGIGRVRRSAAQLAK